MSKPVNNTVVVAYEQFEGEEEPKVILSTGPIRSFMIVFTEALDSNEEGTQVETKVVVSDKYGDWQYTRKFLDDAYDKLEANAKGESAKIIDLKEAINGKD